MKQNRLAFHRLQHQANPTWMFIWACPAILSLVACQPVVIAAPPESATPTSMTISSSAPTASFPIPTLSQATRVPDPSRMVSATFTSSPTERPLRFDFPTPGPQPISAWRPPLYDIPWAPGPYDHFYFHRPIAADEVNWPLADYRYGGIDENSDIVHSGIDIDAPLGAPVLAAAGGMVEWAGYGLFRGVYDTQDPYGLAVAIRHDFGYQGQRLFTVYAHLKEVYVQVGQHVQPGDTLGKVGITGKTSGPHLHFEVRLGKNISWDSRNPELWLAPAQGWGTLVGLLTNADGTKINSKEILVASGENGRTWVVRTYGAGTINSDEYYQENLVLSDLPAGRYRISVVYNMVRLDAEVQIKPGLVTYFRFQGKNLYSFRPPNAPIVFLTPGP
ncbi:MAG: M23 family metallopeptidase [Anaerolineaceae bacterium]|nr:M23 family metallopeptidase [Anaerolineaceae bacterium]